MSTSGNRMAACGAAKALNFALGRHTTSRGSQVQTDQACSENDYHTWKTAAMGRRSTSKISAVALVCTTRVTLRVLMWAPKRNALDCKNKREHRTDLHITMHPTCGTMAFGALLRVTVTPTRLAVRSTCPNRVATIAETPPTCECSKVNRWYDCHARWESKSPASQQPQGRALHLVVTQHPTHHLVYKLCLRKSRVKVVGWRDR